jgi:hypothetical protein
MKEREREKKDIKSDREIMREKTELVERLGGIRTKREKARDRERQ